MGIVDDKNVKLEYACKARNDLYAKGEKLFEDGDKLLEDGAKLHAEGEKLRMKGEKLLKDGWKLKEDGDKLWREATDEVYESIKVECHLETDNVSKP